jgi:hypothetical protein
VIVVFAGVLARQRYMLRVTGGVPVAIQVRGTRWTYGIARFVGGELRWYRAIGLGIRPTKVLSRAHLIISARRSPEPAELPALPVTAVIVQCLDGERAWVLAFSESAFTGFVSWLEATRKTLP